MALDTKTLHKIWTFVETSNPYIIMKLSDDEIVQRLICQVESISPLSLDDSNILNRYISARTPLIRDLAHSKVA